MDTFLVSPKPNQQRDSHAVTNLPSVGRLAQTPSTGAEFQQLSIPFDFCETVVVILLKQTFFLVPRY